MKNARIEITILEIEIRIFILLLHVLKNVDFNEGLGMLFPYNEILFDVERKV